MKEALSTFSSNIVTIAWLPPFFCPAIELRVVCFFRKLLSCLKECTLRAALCRVPGDLFSKSIKKLFKSSRAFSSLAKEGDKKTSKKHLTEPSQYFSKRDGACGQGLDHVHSRFLVFPARNTQDTPNGKRGYMWLILRAPARASGEA